MMGTILLIVIVVVVGGGVAAYAMGFFSTGSTNLGITIVSAQAISTTGTSSIVTLTVKDSGTVALQGATITVDGTLLASTSYAWNPAFGTLATGNSMSTSFNEATWVSGTQHSITVTATGTNGATVTISVKVAVQ